MRGRRCWLALWCWHRDCIFKPLPLSLIPGRHKEERKTDTRVTNMSWARRWHSGQRLRRARVIAFLRCCARGVNEGRRSPAHYHERDIEMAVHGQGVSLLGLVRGALKRAQSESNNERAKSDGDNQLSASATRKCTRKRHCLRQRHFGRRAQPLATGGSPLIRHRHPCAPFVKRRQSSCSFILLFLTCSNVFEREIFTIVPIILNLFRESYF